ncbi:MAG: hypothetical protein A2V86_01775 [Deltaproteobacteria bacterium RBG_16_49_23]|nr:MAG: hypothetical protein A2V86_01775 [Deltaproteobacteria bacterium RBG_16_49_23]
MAYCACCQSNNVDIVGRLTHHAGLPVEVDAYTLQNLVSRYAFQRYQLFLETWDIDVDWDVCYRCYVFSGAERYYPFSMLPQYRY